MTTSMNYLIDENWHLTHNIDGDKLSHCVDILSNLMNNVSSEGKCGPSLLNKSQLDFSWIWSKQSESDPWIKLNRRESDEISVIK